jgi:hypothetical protein
MYIKPVIILKVKLHFFFLGIPYKNNIIFVGAPF